MNSINSSSNCFFGAPVRKFTRPGFVRSLLIASVFFVSACSGDGADLSSTKEPTDAENVANVSAPVTDNAGVPLTDTISAPVTDNVPGNDTNPTDADLPVPAPIKEIYWSDGDSGRLDGVAFRLKDVDAPETQSVGSAFGGAKCELERERGALAKEFIVALTGNAFIQITANYGPDRYDRLVVDLNADGIDVAKAGIEAGHLQAWIFLDSSLLSRTPRPAR